MSPTTSDHGLDEAIHVITGPLTVFTVRTELDALLKSMATGQGVCVHVDGITECDTAGVQLLYSLLKTAKENGMRLRFEGTNALISPTAMSLGFGVDLFGDLDHPAS